MIFRCYVSCHSELGWEDGSGSDGDDDRGRNGESSNKLPGFFESEFKKRRRVSGSLTLGCVVLLLCRRTVELKKWWKYLVSVV